MENFNLTKDDMDKSFGELFNLNCSDYKDISISSLSNIGFNNTTIYELQKKNVLNLGDLLLMSCREFSFIRTVGKKRLTVTLNFFNDLAKGNIDIIAYEISSLRDLPLTIALNRNRIIKGDFSSVEKNENNKKVIEKYMIAQETLGQELATISKTNPGSIMPIIKSLSVFHANQSILINKRKALINLMNSISKRRKNNKIYDYIRLYPSSINDKNILKRIYHKNSFHLTSEEINEIVINKEEYHIVIEFIRWLVIPAQHYIKSLLKKTLRQPIQKRIINLRIEGYSFSEISKMINLSKEQVILKHNAVINSFFSDNNCLAAFMLFSLDMQNKKRFDETELVEEFGSLVPTLIYLYSCSTNSYIKFDKIEKSIIINH